MKDNMQNVNYDQGAGKYTANGFQPARQSSSSNEITILVLSL